MRQRFLANPYTAVCMALALVGCAAAPPQKTPAAHVHALPGDTAAPTASGDDDLDPQQAAQAAATPLQPWRPFGRINKFLGRKPSSVLALWRSLADVSLPGPDLANYPNSSYTLPQGSVYFENSPAGFYGSSVISTSQWNWEYLLRYGVTDNIEFRMFSNGLSAQSGAVGFSPVAFDVKAHVWAEEWEWFNISIGAEAYVQTTSWLASPAFNEPLQYAFSVLVDHELPWDIAFEWNLGFVRQSNPGGVVYLPSVQWAFQRNITDDVALFVQGYHNAATLPRVPGAEIAAPSRPQQVAVGFGGQWAVNKRLAFFGSYNWGLTRYTPSYNANIGFAVSF
ncbi:MAG: transporter [Candidatus Methylumidiphilus sp.]